MARTSSLAWFLLGLCLSRPALADEPTSIPRATTQQVHQTVDRAIGYLQTESAAWLNTSKCVACHHVPMPLWTLSEAVPAGVRDRQETRGGGSSKLLTPITCAASSWATLGLARLAPTKTKESHFGVKGREGSQFSARATLGARE